jgi:transmembrane sensor
LDLYLSRDPSELKISDLAQDRLFIRWVRTDDPEAAALCTAWLMNHPEMEDKVEAARSLVLAMQFEEEEIPANQIQAEWSKLYAKSLREPEQKVSKPNLFRPKGFLSMAAVLLLIALIIPLIYLLINRYSENSPEVRFITRSTSPGQKLSITFSDGTKIKLNSDSEIKYPAQFTRDNREVTLKGEGFFNVVHNDRIPFKVHTDGITVVVMGTSFNVSAYPENTDVQVALEKGKVKIKMNGNQDGTSDIFLKPYEMIEINKSNHTHDIQAFDPSETTSWKDGCLFLGRADFNETIVKLERWFGVKFEIDSHFQSDPDWRFIGKFQDKSLPYILETISHPGLFKYRIEAQKVFVY